MPDTDDLIVAPATPAGTSALALIRVSGRMVPALAEEIFGPRTLAPRVATHRDYRGRDGKVLDDVVVTVFAAPHSYTGEHLLEISLHGNPLIVMRALADLRARGCRAAAAGEFTRRAFLNGRMDLAQAEAVMDVIHAQSDMALTAAQQQLRGALGRHVQALVQRLIAVMAQVEAYIDFPEEDLPTEDAAALRRQLEEVLRGTSQLLATRHYGQLLREGIRTVLVGEPNVGKSSVMNALLGRERALVSPIPGTTRDYLEERWVVSGHLLRLIDTAGLHTAPETLERLGIEKTLEQVAEADLFLLVLDSTRPATWQVPETLRHRLKPGNSLVVWNKVDSDDSAPSSRCPVPYPTFGVSAVSGDGLAGLAAAIGHFAAQRQPAFGGETIAINARHSDALERTAAALRAAQAQLGGSPAELVAAELREALSALGDIAGRIDHERVLDELFASFCIGK